MRNFLVVRLLITALWLLPTAIACADHHMDEKPLRTITVNGEGKLKVKPDTASVRRGLSPRRPRPAKRSIKTANACGR